MEYAPPAPIPQSSSSRSRRELVLSRQLLQWLVLNSPTLQRSSDLVDCISHLLRAGLWSGPSKIGPKIMKKGMRFAGHRRQIVYRIRIELGKQVGVFQWNDVVNLNTFRYLHTIVKRPYHSGILSQQDTFPDA